GHAGVYPEVGGTQIGYAQFGSATDLHRRAVPGGIPGGELDGGRDQRFGDRAHTHRQRPAEYPCGSRGTVGDVYRWSGPGDRHPDTAQWRVEGMTAAECEGDGIVSPMIEDIGGFGDECPVVPHTVTRQRGAEVHGACVVGEQWVARIRGGQQWA